MKRNNEDVQIYLSRHVKAQNLGINDIEIIDKECGTIGVKRDQIYTRLVCLMGREKRIEKYVLRDMARNSYDEQERKYANDRLAEIAAREQEECTEYLSRQIKSNNSICNRMDQSKGDFEGFFEN